MGLPKTSRPAADCTANGPRGDDLAGRQINPVATPKTIYRQATAIRIVITPTPSGRKWRASLDGETLCVSASPLVTSARLLIAKGIDPNRAIEMWHQHADAWALRGQLGAVAATLIDGEKATRPAKNGSLIRIPGMAATGDRNRPPQALAGSAP
jgi:hypothetical protein